MDIFKYTNPYSKTKMEGGQIVNNITKKMWIERYQEAGEFTFTAPVWTGMKDILPIGCFVSHIDTGEVMIVENHEINERKDQPSEIVITGRSFETYFENRIVGSNIYSPFSGEIKDYVLVGQPTWIQIVSLINAHILASELIDDNNAIPYVSAAIVSVPSTGVSVDRFLKRGTLYEHILDLLKIDNLGIKTMRPGATSFLQIIWDSSNLGVIVYKGVNKTQSIVFSYDAGELESADYLWSNKKSKNAILVSGKWVEVVVVSTDRQYNRRWMFTSASDIDDELVVAPTGLELTQIVAVMRERGNKILLTQKNITLTKAEAVHTAIVHKYRIDYNLGDLVTVNGDYNESAIMRVTEHVEFEDETGSGGYPTLAIDPPPE